MATALPTIVPLSAIDSDLIEDLLDAAFGEQRRARTAYRIREGVEWLPGLSFAALDDEEYLVATIQLWPVALTDPDGRSHPLLMVGPVAVMPGRQGEGYGKARKDLDRLSDDVTTYVRDNPGRSVLIAGALGFFLGLLIRGDRRR